MLVLVEKASFSKEFREEFQRGGKDYPLHTIKFIPDSDMLFPYS